MSAQKYGTIIQQLRKERGWSQTVLADNAGGLNKETVNRAEAGANVRADTLRRIADALGVEMAELYGRSAGDSAAEGEKRASTIDSGASGTDNAGTQPATVPAPAPPSPPSTPPSPEEYKLPHKLVSFLVAHLTAGLYVMSVEAQRVTIRSLRGHLDAAAGPLGEEQAPAVRVSNSRHQ